MNKRKTIFVDGITGLLVSFLTREILQKGYKIIALARASKDVSAEKRVMDAMKFVYDDEWNPEFVRDNLEIIEGDITKTDLGITNIKLKEKLISEVDIIVHSAALAELQIPINIIRRINVEGTRHILDFALRCKENGRLNKVFHISTMYIVGKKVCKVDESNLDVGQAFHNSYEQSKYEAELLTKEYSKKGLNISIFRPSMIMGDSKTGRTNSFRLFYQPLHYFSRELFSCYPGNFDCSQNLINIDTVASAMSFLLERQENCTYHIISPHSTTIKLLIESAAEYFGFKVPRFIPIEEFNFNRLTPAQIQLARPHIPYFNYKALFMSENTHQILTKYGFSYPKITKKIYLLFIITV